MHDPLQMLIALAVVGMLGRAARPAWHNRLLATAIWRRIRLRHVLGCLLLLGVVLGVALGLMRVLPVTGWGLGRLVGLDGNAVFAPLQQASEVAQEVRAPEPGTSAEPVPQTDWVQIGLATGFMGLLLLLFPWLAYVEERMFRSGLEEADLGGQFRSALRFGVVHLLMFIPIAAAAGIGVAGFVYGRIYRRAYAEAMGRPPEFESPFGPRRIIETPARRARTEAILATTVWHTTFNSLIVLIVLAGFLLGF